MHCFDQDIRFTPAASGSFEGRISDNWSVNGTPNGGYLAALMANAMLQQSRKKAPIIVTTTFIARSIPGRATVSIENINCSKQFDRWQARLFQQNKQRVHAIGTFAKNARGSGEKRYEKAPPQLAPIGTCIAITALDSYTIFHNLDIRLDPSCAGWMKDDLTQRSEQKGWARFKSGRTFDAQSLLLIADAFPPPAVASHGLIAWIPTLEFSVNIRNLPETEWLKCIFRTRFIDNDILEEDGEIWDANNTLVAVSRQIAQFRKEIDLIAKPVHP